MSAKLKLPLKLGGKGGYNVNLLTDSVGNSLASLYGLPSHTKVDEIDARFAEGRDRAEEIIRRVNSHDAMV